MKIALVHLMILLASLSIASWSANVFWKATFPVIMIELAVSIIIIFSLLDYLNIVEFRKSVVRKTKCCICGRVSKKEYVDNILVKSEKTKSKKDGESEKEITTEKKIPAEPLEGIIISDKVICTDCIKKVKKIG